MNAVSSQFAAYEKKSVIPLAVVILFKKDMRDYVLFTLMPQMNFGPSATIIASTLNNHDSHTAAINDGQTTVAWPVSFTKSMTLFAAVSYTHLKLPTNREV